MLAPESDPTGILLQAYIRNIRILERKTISRATTLTS